MINNVHNRRDLCFALASLGGFAAVSHQAAAQAEAGSSPEPKLIHSQLFPFDSLRVGHSTNGGESRSVTHGTLATGEFVEVHETMLPPGQMPHPPHRHTHSEFLLIREGKLEVISEGQHGLIESGGVVFTASGVLHSLKNVGDVPANYFVVAIGSQKALP